MRGLISILSIIVFVFSSKAQSVTGYLTTSGGSYTSEKWTNVTTGANGTGTVIWEQGGGSIGTGAGLITDEAITLTCGTTYYLNTFDRYDDGWDGTTYELRDATGGGGTLIINNGGASPNDGSNADATSSWTSSEYTVDIETSESFSVACPCVDPTIGSATVISTNCGTGTFDVQLTINSDGQGGSVTVSDGGTNPNQVVSTFPSTVTFSSYAAGSTVTLNVDNGTCNVDANTVSEDCSCPSRPSATITTANLDCNANTFDIVVSSINTGSGSSVDVYVDGVLDVAGSQLTGKTPGTNYTVTLVSNGSGYWSCQTDYHNVTDNCPTPCAGTATVLTNGFTQSNITTPGSGGVDDWVGRAEACGTADEGEFEDSDVKLFEYTTGSVAGEAVYFTIEYNYSADKSHSIGMWSDCVNDSLTGCQTSYYNFDDVAGVCATGLAANTTYYIGVSNNYFNREDLDFDVIEFTVETSNSIPDDECATAPTMTISSPYIGSTRCSYTASSGSPGGCGTIENDSWVAFVASETTSILDYQVSNCTYGYGVQLAVFEGSCGSMSLVSGSCLNYASNNSTGTWTLNGLTPGNTYYIRADGYAGDLCSYSYTSVGGVLPVQLLSFTGKGLENGVNRLAWSTASEINNDYYVIEKSIDGEHFEVVNRQSGAGSSLTQNDYIEFDRAITAKTYYRLKQVDFNGSFTYSDVIIVENSVEELIQVYPNPTQGELKIEFKGVEADLLRVIDITGRQVMTINEDLNTVNISHLPAGLYWLQVQTLNKVYTKQIKKQ